MSIEWIKKISRVEKKKTQRKTRRRTSAVTAWNLQATCNRISELPLIRRLEMATIAIVLWQCLDGIMSCWRMALISLGIRRAPMQETDRHRQQAAVWGCKRERKKKKKCWKWGQLFQESLCGSLLYWWFSNLDSSSQFLSIDHFKVKLKWVRHHILY